MKSFSLYMMFISIVACAFILSCGTNKEVLTDPLLEQQQVDFSTVGKSVLYGAGEEGIEMGNLVIRTSDEWEALKNQLDAVNNVTYNFEGEPVDFGEYILIACFDEVRPHGGYDLKIKNITESETKIEVTIRLIQPTGENTSVMIQPFQIVQIPITVKEIVFN